MTMMWPLTVEGKPLEVSARWAEPTGFAYDAARDGLPAHEMERGLWQYLPRRGHELPGQDFALAGDGDGGEPPLNPARVGRAAPAVLPSPPRRPAPG